MGDRLFLPPSGSMGMGIVQLAILIVVIIAIVAIVAWFVRKSGITIPEPVLYALYALLAIFAILLVANLAGLGPPILK